MLNQAVLARGYWIEFLYLYRAKFAAVVVNGISVSFFNNSGSNINSEKHL